jgi:hypothetical protein
MFLVKKAEIAHRLHSLDNFNFSCKTCYISSVGFVLNREKRYSTKRKSNGGVYHITRRFSLVINTSFVF